MDMRTKDDSFIVCPCRGKSKGEVLEAIKKNRITEVDILAQVADVGNKCGGCREDLAQLIEMAWEK